MTQRPEAQPRDHHALDAERLRQGLFQGVNRNEALKAVLHPDFHVVQRDPDDVNMPSPMDLRDFRC